MIILPVKVLIMYNIIVKERNTHHCILEEPLQFLEIQIQLLRTYQTIYLWFLDELNSNFSNLLWSNFFRTLLSLMVLSLFLQVDTAKVHSYSLKKFSWKMQRFSCLKEVVFPLNTTIFLTWESLRFQRKKMIHTKL